MARERQTKGDEITRGIKQRRGAILANVEIWLEVGRRIEATAYLRVKSLHVYYCCQIGCQSDQR